MNIVKIPLTQGKEAIIDACDYEKISMHKWHFMPPSKPHRNNGYAKTNIRHPNFPHKRKTLFMQHLILPPKEEFLIDHKDRNGLNNCRNNLRYCTPAQNIMNGQYYREGQFRGVYKQSCGNTWMVKMARIYLGNFSSQEEAAKAYDTAALERYGEFATLNFPQSNF